MAEWLTGRHAIEECIGANRRRILELWVDSPSRCDGLSLPPQLKPRTEPLRALNKRVGGTVHQGMAMRVEWYPYVEPEVHLASQATPILLVDRPQDPQNLGGLLRTSWIAGVAGVWLPRRGGAGVTPAAVRASAGAAEKLEVALISSALEAVRKLKKENYWVFGLDMSGTDLFHTPLPVGEKVAFVAGGEGRGLTPPLAKLCHGLLRIPQARPFDSLNLGVSVAVVLFEFLRRSGGDEPPDARSPVTV